ncbi:MAG: NPP1 family protein, partial [Planctomycetota bacterium]
TLYYTVKSNRMLPIKFCIENHPSIWARVLRTKGISAFDAANLLIDQFDLTAAQMTQLLVDEEYDIFRIGTVLRDLFGLEAEEMAQVLKDIGSYSASEIAEVLLSLFSFDDEPMDIARILKNVGFGAAQILDVLKAPPFNLTDQEVLAILESLGFSSEDLFGITARGLAEQFAPQLRFDALAWTFPMSAQEYFENNIESAIGPIENTDPSTLTAADPNLVPPTYFKAFKVDNQVRILYWWYYGWQPGCVTPIGIKGTHDGDWEHVMVILSEDASKVVAVAYWQHSGWYTRLAQGGDSDRFLGASYRPGLSFYEDHPIVYVGLGQHGSYHNQGGDLLFNCAYYGDFRIYDGLHLDCERNLKSLADIEEDWMFEETSTTDGLVAYGDGVTVAFDLDSKYVKGIPLAVRLDGQIIEPNDFTFSDNSGADGMDQIVFDDPPGVDVEITADWERGDFKWGCGPCREGGIGTHPVKSSTYSAVASRKSCKGFDAGFWGVVKGCFESQCEYHDNQTGWTDLHPGTCSHCPPGYTDMGFYCGKGFWPWEWSTRSIHYYGLEYTIPRTDKGLSVSQ